MKHQSTPQNGERCHLEPITIEDFNQALLKTLGRRGMKVEEVKYISHFILNFFGYEERTLDNILTQKDRDVFYMLEEEGILKTFQEETTLYGGKDWRIHYWVLNKEYIHGLANGEISLGEEFNPPEAIYMRLDEDIWERRTIDRVTE